MCIAMVINILYTYSVVKICSKSPTVTIPRSHQSSSHQRHSSNSQHEMELSIYQTSKGSRRSSIKHVLAKTNSLSRSLVESFDTKVSLPDSVRSGIIVIPRVLPISEAPTSATTMAQSVDKNNTNTTIAVVEHHNDSANLVPSSPAIPPTISPVSEHIGDFATNERHLQLYLKQNGFPYRMMRRNVETDLEAGLQAYFELDVLDENNKFMCDQCTANRMEKRGFL